MKKQKAFLPFWKWQNFGMLLQKDFQPLSLFVSHSNAKLTITIIFTKKFYIIEYETICLWKKDIYTNIDKIGGII
jgi:hypothetical protein